MAASSRYRAKKKKAVSTDKVSYTGTQKEEPLIGTRKILLMLVLGTGIVSGIYITAIKMMFAPIMHIYWITAAILLMLFMYIKMRNEYLYAEITKSHSPSDEEMAQHRKRTKAMKYLLIALLPFLFTLFGDLVYLYLLKDLDFIGAIKNLI